MASKTPTLVELRKLAKRKFGPSATVERGYWPSERCTAGTVWATEDNIRRWQLDFHAPTRKALKCGLFAALSALPDKERAR